LIKIYYYQAITIINKKECNMKNTILKVGLFNLGLSILGLNSTLTQAGVVDFSKCGLTSFAVVTQSEGPTYACGGIDNGVGNPINVLNGNKFEAVEDFKELPAFKGLSSLVFIIARAMPIPLLVMDGIVLLISNSMSNLRLSRFVLNQDSVSISKNKISLGNNQFVIRALL
jgi:hypothetical protein